MALPSSLTLPPPLRRAARSIRARLPELNFITLHYTYFTVMALLSALVFWGSSDPLRSVSFIDSLFLTTSSLTEAGLNTVNLSELTTWQQVILFLLMLMGSAIFVSAWIVVIRLKAFEKAFVNLKQERVERRLKRRNTGFSKAKSLVAGRRGKDPVPLALKPQDARGHPDYDQKSPILDEKPEIAYEPGGSPDPELARTANNSKPGVAQNSTNKDGVRGRQLLSMPSPQGQCPSQSPTGHDRDHEDHAPQENSPAAPHVAFGDGTKFRRPTNAEYRKIHKPILSFTGVGATAHASIRPHSLDAPRQPSISRATPLPDLYTSTNAYFDSKGWISRNSQFHGLSTEERLILGGFEYRAVVFLSFLVPFYFFTWQVLGALSLGAWVNNHRASLARENGFNPWWVGSFNAVSAFNNSGMSLLDANAIAFQDSAFMLLSMGIFILAGNTAYPIFLRGAIWLMYKAIPSDDPHWLDEKQTLKFLLDHPRRCYTNLFPARHTWWLALVLVALNTIDWAFFPILNINNNAIHFRSVGIEVLDGLFQALAVRSGGFYVVPIPDMRISLQFLYCIMMYFSVYPVVISMRNSNVYEERSLGVFAEDIEQPDEKDNPDGGVAANQTSTGPTTKPAGIKRRLTNFSANAAAAPNRESRSYFVRQQMRAQLAHDAWFVVFAIFLILIIEAQSFDDHPVWFSAFNVIFEVISAYATVGLSVGVPYDSFSFSGSWRTLSKLVLIAVMLRGRHRGLPVAIDNAVLLPAAHLYDAEFEDGERRLERAQTARSPVSPVARHETVPPAQFASLNSAVSHGTAPTLNVPRALRPSITTVT